MIVYLDVETVPDMRPGRREAFRAQVRAPANYGEQKATEWIATKGADKAEDLWRKTALRAERGGELVCIAFAVQDGPVRVVWRDLDGSERDLLHALWGHLSAALTKSTSDYRVPEWCGHNVDFDLRYLRFRSAVHRIRPPYAVNIGSRDNVDTMYLATGSRRPDDWISLPDLCHALGVDDYRDDIPGAEVCDRMLAGDVDAVVHHCRRDVERVRNVHRLLTFQTETRDNE